MLLFFAFSDSDIDQMAFGKITIEILFMLILGLIAKKVKLIVHVFGFLLMLFHYSVEFANARSTEYNLYESFSYGCQFQMQMMFYFIAAVILSTNFIWTIPLTTPIFMVGNIYLHFLNAEVFELEGWRMIIICALKSGLQPLLVVTMCSWIIADREMSAFFK